LSGQEKENGTMGDCSKKMCGLLGSLKSAWIEKYFSDDLDFRARLFNVLAVGGLVVSAIMAAKAVVTTGDLLDMAINASGAVMAWLLLSYSSRSGNFQRCYLIVIIVYFLILFPVLFFLSDGYRGGMPAFFVFAILFTVFMLDGAAALVIAAAEIVVYVAVCLIAYARPDYVQPFASEWLRMQDVVFAFVCSAGTIGLALHKHFDLYKRQQSRLEEESGAARRANAAKNVFLANMSHEIRTPINVMLGLNEMMTRMGEDAGIDGLAKYGGYVRRSGEILMKIVNDLLDLSRLELGSVRLDQVDYSLPELIGDLCLLTSQRMEGRNLEFFVAIDEHLPPVLFGDVLRLKQVLTNLLTNAVKYTEQGSVTLSVSARDGEAADEKIILFSVADTGIGIEPQEISDLFEKFSRADTSSSRNVEGAGLGLAIAKDLAGLMGGHISVQSYPGQGSTFEFWVPQKISYASPSVALEDEGKKTETSPAQRDFFAARTRVLVVDDNEGNIRVFQAMLAGSVGRLDAAQSGRECLEMARRAAAAGNPYHVILLDYMMPGLDGLSTFKRLREEIPGFDTPVVAVTADATPGTREMFLEAGFAMYLSKPIRWSDLSDALVSFLPPELVVRSDSAPKESLSGGEAAAMELELAACGVSLSKAMKYADGNISLFRELSGIFVEDSGPSRTRVEAMVRVGDYEGLSHEIHSLKNRAGVVGAMDLKDSAVKFLRYCRAEDEEYVRVSSGLLLLEWRRAQGGLSGLLARLDGAEKI
jgi:signal transduction histidine kinase/CheY-like chemotaxis protein/HPt (histidine-containing phosphotransfer) domain-containing protein